MDALSLYIHIPFCVRKCRYCDFLSGPADEMTRQRYIDMLVKEIREAPDSPLPFVMTAEACEKRRVDTIFFGGGTPSLLSVKQLSEVMEAIHDRYEICHDAEVSLECNPGTADLQKLKKFRECGINRLSIGVQSFNDEELRLLGRIHDSQKAVEIFEDARRAGFDNINLDLMSALPGQNVCDWMRNLKTAAELKPEHISCYSLILEDGTELKKLADKGVLPPFPDDETDRLMVHETGQFLKEAGYEQYEISNYAMKGKECRHNCGYWTGHEYLGLGLGSSSMMKTDEGYVRFCNTHSMDKYLDVCSDSTWDRLHDSTELLAFEDKVEEFMFLGLRMNCGVSIAEFSHKFNNSIDDIYGTIIAGHVQNGLLEKDGDRLRLTKRGRDLANYVMSDFILT